MPSQSAAAAPPAVRGMQCAGRVRGGQAGRCGVSATHRLAVGAGRVRYDLGVDASGQVTMAGRLRPAARGTRARASRPVRGERGRGFRSPRRTDGRTGEARRPRNGCRRPGVGMRSQRGKASCRRPIRRIDARPARGGGEGRARHVMRRESDGRGRSGKRVAQYPHPAPQPRVHFRPFDQVPRGRASLTVRRLRAEAGLCPGPDSRAGIVTDEAPLGKRAPFRARLPFADRVCEGTPPHGRPSGPRRSS